MFTQDAICVSMPVMIKSIIDKAGRRIVEFEGSNTQRDSEGDVIIQKALLDSAPTFIARGHVDIDHYSELGRNPAYSFLGIKNPEEWIIGVPLDVFDMGRGRTGVKAEIYKNKDGVIDSSRFKYDMFWQSLQTEPPARWFASVYGYPGDDTEYAKGGASRYLVKSFDWKSIAVTRTPINDTLKSSVTIVSAKSFAAKLPHLSNFAQDVNVMRRADLRVVLREHLSKACPVTDSGGNISVKSIREHFINCDKLGENLADIYALAAAELVRRDREHYN